MQDLGEFQQLSHVAWGHSAVCALSALLPERLRSNCQLLHHAPQLY